MFDQYGPILDSSASDPDDYQNLENVNMQLESNESTFLNMNDVLYFDKNLNQNLK